MVAHSFNCVSNNAKLFVAAVKASCIDPGDGKIDDFIINLVYFISDKDSSIGPSVPDYPFLGLSKAL